MKPLCIDLFCGLGGWAEGFLAEGYEVIGFDIERHRYPKYRRVSDDAGNKVPGNNSAIRWEDRPIARLKDAKGELLDGWEEYPGQLVLQDVLTLDGRQFRDAAVIVASPPCQAYSYMAMPWTRAKQRIEWHRDPGAATERIAKLTALFDACFRIAREAGVPLVVENVKGAQPWVGAAKWHYGSYYLWGDVPALMPLTNGNHKIVSSHLHLNDPTRANVQRLAATTPKLRPSREAIKNNGGSWFNIGSPGQTETNRNPVHEGGKGFVTGLGRGHDWRQDPSGRFNSKSNARKAASAQIAKIPFPLAQWIARVYKPDWAVEQERTLEALLVA